ncbi:MAG: Fe-S cluster assembly protein SufD, partial [Myxococcaceae bacterium]|nr:Fe-S cluster assembly protein SufD [Myxococcaceae bacterium]
PALVEQHLATFAEGPFVDLNTALFEDGVVVLVPPGTVVSEPIHVVFFSRGGPAPRASHPRALIVLGRGSQATVVESYGGADDALYWTNAVTEAALEDGAILDHYKVQREATTGDHTATMAVVQGRDSRFRSFHASLGGALARTDIRQRFGGQGGECVLDGLFMARGRQHTDTHTLIDHAVPHCASRELYKGVLDGQARGVFHGTILVRPDAQKTDAHQVNKNLLLSREALVNSTPALEIHADDVKCKHGSTTGQLDALALFYLRARGLAEAEARSLLVRGFASDLVARVGVSALRSGLEEFLQAWLPGALDGREDSVA